MYNSLIILRKLNPENNTMTHLLFRQALIKELIQFHLYGSKPLQTEPVGADANPLRLVERHFICTLPATQNKARAQRKCLRCSKLGIRRNTRFWCSKCGVTLCFYECFEVYHTFKDFTKSLNAAHDSADESDN